MGNTVKNKLKNRLGLARAIVILIIIAALLAAVAILIPTIAYYREQSKKIGCVTALDTAYRQYIDAYLTGVKGLDKEETKEVVTFAMCGWDDLCPGGGNIFIVKDEEKGHDVYRLVCGLHDEDLKERVRLNAGYVLDTVREAVAAAREKGDPVPDSATRPLSGKELVILRTDEPSTLRRGTDSTMDYEGTVAFYSVVGIGDDSDASGQKDGEVWSFTFADENYCAKWNYRQSWTGDAYK